MTLASHCDENTRCFFNAIVTGTFAWIPAGGNFDVPTFFLNNGTVEKVELENWHGEARFMLPVV